MTASTGIPAGVPAVTLEDVFGDPYDPDNPYGCGPVLAADERAERFAAGERLLEEWGLNAEFVPRDLGGRLDGLDELVRRLRPVFRRDAALGLGYGITSFMAAVNVWLGGSDEQRRSLAGTLLAGGRAAVAYHELDHGNDLLRNELQARVEGDQLILDGRKEVINNAARAERLVLFARTDDRPGGRSHTLLLLDTASLPAGRWTVLPRFRTVGMRGCELAGVSFDACPVPRSTVVGGLGKGVEIALRSFQVTRCVTAGLGLGVLDAGLHTVLRFAAGRHLYGRPVAELPHARASLAGAFTDLLAADCLATVAARSVHLLPGQASAYAAAVKYLVPLLVEEAMHDLSVVLGARFYLREGEHAIFGKHARDLPALSIGHAGSVACQLALLPQLPSLARGATRGEPAPADVFRPGVPVPALRLDRLRLVGTAEDPLMACLPGEVAALRRDGAPESVVRLGDRLLAELDRLREQAGALPPTQRGVLADSSSLRLTETYAVLLAAIACLGVRRHHGGPSILTEPAWLHAALSRLVSRLDHRPTMLPWACADPLFAELTRRTRSGHGLCLAGEPVARTLPDPVGLAGPPDLPDPPDPSERR